MMSSTLVETVSINCEDFNDSFLTCGTCLCTYDAQERTPKLLPCSHTVCRNCLDRIIAAQTLDTGSFRCPICREAIHIPQGGVSAFPPSFIVNQLLDLMAQQRRDVVPKCSVHGQQELLFCETCDLVFCLQCVDGGHSGRGASEHTVIPFAIAIKRMSEILLYKAHLCIKNLNAAYEAVSDELRQLEISADKTLDAINKSFKDVVAVIDRRRQDCLLWVRKIREEKKNILKEQLDLIQAEKDKVQVECDGLQYQVEVRNITKKISDLNEKLDTTSTLSEPRENSFLHYEYKHNDALREVAKAISNFGNIRVSTTFPALTTAEAKRATAHLRCSVRIITTDYHGNLRTNGGDPVFVDIRNEKGDLVDSKVKDNDDGTYDVLYLPSKPGKLKMTANIFGRPIKNSPLSIEVSEHIDPVWRFGSRGTGQEQLNQPVRIAAGAEGDVVYVLDTGNSRIVVLGRDGSVLRHLGPAGVEQQSATGLSVMSSGQLVVINWRSKMVSVLSPEDGSLVRSFTTPGFVEPIDVAVNSRGEVVVADSGAKKIFKFDTSGNLVTTFGSHGDKDGQFKVISGLCVGKNDEILVADHRIQIFTKDGKYSRKLVDPGSGSYGGIAVDSAGNVLATKTEKSSKSDRNSGAGPSSSSSSSSSSAKEKGSGGGGGSSGGGRSFVHVFHSNGKLLYSIDSHSDRLRRPSGLAVLTDYRIVVADLGNNCVKKFYYK
ncbi:tripartite motif-containing protein 2 [Aplysia californica]|uniref:Tripartite motif-containing protein 2 n=1 Tax=Aplysia californica TaxID=6500 RepID=A0ABM0KAS1_APLCA|nr:tripartite motif-containing protein 2 [Aplysia californica]